MKKLALLSVCIFLFVSVAVAFADGGSDAIVGDWYTKDKESVVSIYKDGDYYSGKVTWLCEKESKEPDGSPRIDKNNPDPEKSKQTIVGLVLAKGFTFDGKKKWTGGTIYDPENGKNYSCKIKLQKNGKELKVRGFIGVSLIGRNEYWTRK